MLGFGACNHLPWRLLPKGVLPAGSQFAGHLVALGQESISGGLSARQSPDLAPCALETPNICINARLWDSGLALVEALWSTKARFEW